MLDKTAFIVVFVGTGGKKSLTHGRNSSSIIKSKTVFMWSFIWSILI